ncbi:MULTISPECIES: metalloregulator ArsR/SmtB family transcription factor [unclassified Microbacterium]|uniref:metalloregulator ArsR/SmtB family transcription factor n=1 Tax=unclassified Microbacterium TaxID=2609290 RepID=UPI000EA86C94|nr:MULTISPECIES: metalloregulator ArsR/SmtB family transcription factor [unclassified Microbacterium]MBT2483738.1 metalloregulator ArsR/SmtB family transcription factor [Microbacterium sp. ISL-108]RKN66730.1 ArsR family transcriptional regulator [Microbacterium sp. CGR2]
MIEWLTALADPARWRIVLLLADRPQSVGVIAELSGLRQPQASKHLQTLERAGVAVSRRSGQRRIYALEPEALRALATEIARIGERAASGRVQFDQHSAAVVAETEAADRDRWADGREYVFRRPLVADLATTWEHLTEPDLLRRWWAPSGLRLAHIEFGTRVGDPIAQVYVDAADTRGTGVVVGEATGVIDHVAPHSRIDFTLSPRLADGTIGFTGHYRWDIADADEGTQLEVRLLLDDTVIPSAEFVAGIELGWNECLDELAALLTAATSSTSTSTSTMKESQ